MESGVDSSAETDGPEPADHVEAPPSPPEVVVDAESERRRGDVERRIVADDAGSMQLVVLTASEYAALTAAGSSELRGPQHVADWLYDQLNLSLIHI